MALVAQLTPECLGCLIANDDGQAGPPPIEPCLSTAPASEDVCMDMSGDDFVSTDDLLILLSLFGSSCDAESILCPDANGDGRVSTEDLLRLLSQFGSPC